MNSASSRAQFSTHVIQGGFVTSCDPDEMLTTILGSCICTCFFDSVANIGGMNHFLIGEAPAGSSDDLKYGLHAMELIINDLLKLGASRNRLEAKLFGGANMLSGMTDIGQRNAKFALDFLQREGIPISGQSLGGTQARRIRFWPVSGCSQQMLVKNAAPVNKQESKLLEQSPQRKQSGSVDFF